MLEDNIFTLPDIKGKTFVSGLFWQSIPGGTQAEVNKEVKRLSADLADYNYDVAVARSSSVYQVGFGSQIKGQKKGFLSAAAVISKTIEKEAAEDGKIVKNFLVAIRLPNEKYIYVAQRDGAILPDDGDMIGSQIEIKSKMLAHISASSWDLIIAPELWDVGESLSERDFESFLPRKSKRIDIKKWWELQPIKNIGNPYPNLQRNLIIGLLMSGIAFGGNMAYKRYEEKRLAEIQRLAALEAEKNGLNGPKKPEHPWKTIHRATDVVAACMGAMDKFDNLFPYGWKLQDITCSSDIATALWKREETGWVENLVGVVPKAVISSDGNTASFSIPYEVKGELQDEELPEEQARALSMFGSMQKYGVKLTIQPPAPPPPPLPGQEPLAPPDWRENVWIVNGMLINPDFAIKALDDKGFRLTKIQAQLNTTGSIIWNLEGTQYVKP